MAPNPKWNPKSIYKGLKRWLQDPEIHRVVRENAQFRINGYIEDTVECWKVPVGLSLLYTCKAAEGVVGLMEGHDESLDHMYQAVYYYMYYVKFHKAIDDSRPPRKGQGFVSFHDTNLALAHAITLGCTAEALYLGACLLEGMETGWFEWRDPRKVAPFILKLHVQAQNLPVPDVLKTTDLYTRLLQLWQSEDLDALGQMLLAACDFHQERSRNSTQTITYEFEQDHYRLFPVEILALLRLREQRGLRNPTLNHSLFQTPLGRLYEVKQVPHDPRLEQVLTKFLASSST